MSQADTVVLAPAGYVVDPDLGSEPERPWRLAEGLVQRGLRVVMVARDVKRLNELGPKVELERPPGGSPKTPAGKIIDRVNLYLHARRVARREVASGRALVVHHMGPCSEQSPSLIGKLPVPFVYGPLPIYREDNDQEEWLSWLGTPNAPAYQAFLSRAIAGPGGAAAHWMWRTGIRRAAAITVEAKVNVPTWSRKVDVIPPGVDTIQFSPQEGQVPVTGRILAVGKLFDRKGYDVLIRAVARIIPLYPAAHVVLVGSGPQEQSLRLLATQLGVSSSVTFAGTVPRANLPTLLSSSEVFCHPARWDTFPLVPLEAMACGVPTLVSSAGAMPEIVGNAGLVHKVGDDAELAHHLLDVLPNTSLKQALGSSARSRVLERFTWQAMTDSYYELYCRLAASTEFMQC
jgi:glycosyltransferase involved in cell wall biosynthesis